MTIAPRIRVRGLGKVFGEKPQQVEALKDIDLEVCDNEFVTLVGASGCGKSTFLRLIAGLMPHTSGTLTVANVLPEEARRSTQRVAFVFQEPNLLPWRTVAANIGLPLELRGASADERSQRVNESLSLIGLTRDDARKRPRNLSGGMRMRV